MKPRSPKPSGHGKLAVPHWAGGDSNALRPHFSLEYLISGFDVNACDQEQRAEFAKALGDRSKLEWARLINSDRKGLGSEKIANLKVPIPDSVPANHRDCILAFRFGKLARFLGYREGRVFHVIWIDPNGKTYDHE